jgi:predicted nucleic acid-binding protein
LSGLIFVDTSAWFAIVNKSDPDHQAASDLLTSCPGHLVTSNFVFDETITLCACRLGCDAAVRVGEALLDPHVVDLIRVTPQDEAAAWRLFRSRRDKGYSFTDCTSFVMMRRLRIATAAALDDDFRQEGFELLTQSRMGE